MNIAMFTDSWLPAMDGCVASVLKFRDGLEKRGHKVYVFAPEDKTGKLQPDDKTYLFKAKEFKQYPGYRMALYLSREKDDILKELDIQMLHNHGVAFMAMKAMFSSRFLDLPVLLHFHTWVTEASQYYPFNLNDDVMEKLIWRYLKPLCRRSDGVAAPSRTAIEELREKVPGMAYSDWVFPGIDHEMFNPGIRGDDVRRMHGLDGKDVLLHVGRVSKEKNLDLIFDAMPLIKKARPDAKLLIVGDGPARAEYQAGVKARKLEDDVIFTGFVPDAILPKYYAACDTFVMASKFETLGIVMTEALAVGKPVAGINFRVVPEIIKDGYNGHLFEPDPSDCARKVVACLENPDGMSRNAVESASMFDTDSCMEKMEAIYQKTIEVKESRAAEKNHGM